MSGGNSESASRESRLEQVLAEYLRAIVQRLSKHRIDATGAILPVRHGVNH